jgi:hypothetical protein
MQDALSGVIAAPVPVTIAGRECKLSYPMHAAIVYRRETARIERSRPQPEDPDPRCVCGARKSNHKGPGLIRVEDDNLLCPRFRYEDPLLGDSLFNIESWMKINLAFDPERWTACLWAGMHELQPDGKTWKAPFTFEELEASIGICAETRAIGEKMDEAMRAWFPKEKARDPNAQAAPDASPAPTADVEVQKEVEVQKTITTSNGSTPAPVDASELIATSS